MDSLTVLFIICAVAGTLMALWMKTKSGKKWLEEL